MKVFLSWSGERSKAVAELLNNWLCCVIQAARPWISTRDIDRGALWFSEINEQLQDTSIGIICLTQENKNKPWILFEAGALTKGLSTSRVCTFLIDLESQDVENPLAQFNHTLPTQESMHNLVRTLNGALGPNGLTSGVLDRVFDTYWPQFHKEFKEILKTTEQSPTAKPRKQDDLLSEILLNTRSMTTRINQLEMKINRENEIIPTSDQRIKVEISNMIDLNIPDEVIISQFSDKAPPAFIRAWISQAKMEKTNRKFKIE